MTPRRPKSVRQIASALIASLALFGVAGWIWTLRSGPFDSAPGSGLAGLQQSPPLTHAVQQGDTRTSTKLLNSGISPNSVLRDEDGDAATSLMLAAAEGQVEVVRLLLDRGASIDLCGESGVTAATAAAEALQPRTLKLLLDRGGHVGALPQTLGFLEQRKLVAKGDELRRVEQVLAMLRRR